MWCWWEGGGVTKILFVYINIQNIAFRIELNIAFRRVLDFRPKILFSKELFPTEKSLDAFFCRLYSYHIKKDSKRRSQ